jgi:hypothetical protein
MTKRQCVLPICYVYYKKCKNDIPLDPIRRLVPIHASPPREELPPPPPPEPVIVPPPREELPPPPPPEPVIELAYFSGDVVPPLPEPPSLPVIPPEEVPTPIFPLVVKPPPPPEELPPPPPPEPVIVPPPPEELPPPPPPEPVIVPPPPEELPPEPVFPIYPTEKIRITPCYTKQTTGILAAEPYIQATLANVKKQFPTGDHSPRGVTWLPKGIFDDPKTQWDGKPRYFCDFQTKDEFWSYVYPTGDMHVMRGIGQLYDKLQPFQDPKNPTIPEIDYWNMAVINHYRALLGARPAKFPPCMSLRTLWAHEKRYSNAWDTIHTEYKCFGNPTAPQHCGAVFVPPEEYRQPYYDCSDNNITQCNPSSEGDIGGTKDNMPFGVMMSRVIGNAIRADGHPFVHAGTFLNREFVGYTMGGYSMDSTKTFRQKGTAGTFIIKGGGNFEACPNDMTAFNQTVFT